MGGRRGAQLGRLRGRLIRVRGFVLAPELSGLAGSGGLEAQEAGQVLGM
jgi:hypothetical protein